ncbi:MAG: VIT1/CCC1 transporter family protein, partial [Pseudomonadota bacterium]
MARADKNGERRRLFTKLAEEAEVQAAIWKQGLPLAGKVDEYQPELRTRIVAFLICIVGAHRIKPVLAASKIRGLSIYKDSSTKPVQSLNRKQGIHATPTSVEEVGASHRGGGNSGGLRAAVFGVNDGLVSIACLMMGVAGAAISNGAILVTGIAGLLAGAFSMAAGEYISMRSQREMFEYQIGLERAELAEYPEQEAAELTLIYQARGMHADEAESLAQRMIADPVLGLDTLAREELGLNPDDLGSPWVAAASSFLAFLCGGLIPLLPFLASTLFKLVGIELERFEVADTK